MVHSLPTTIVDDTDQYDGYSSVISPPTSVSSNTKKDDTVEPKLNDELSTYIPVFSYKHCLGSANRSYKPRPSHNVPQPTSTFGNYQIIIDSGATCHMWNDPTAFLTYKRIHNSFVQMANKQKVPIEGIGTIQICVNGFTLRIHGVYHIPTLAFCLYSVKEHMRYYKCFTHFGNNKAILSFPKFKFNIFNEDDLFISAHSLGQTTNKIHWDSKDNIKHQKCSIYYFS